MKNKIILRDCPKEKVQIDLWPFEISGGFRGFQNVAEGIHYIAVLFQEKYHGQWVFVEEKTIVKAFDRDALSFVHVEETTEMTLQDMADKGVMNDKLIFYPDIAAEQWRELSGHVTIQHFQDNLFLPTVLEDDMDIPHFLGGFQLAFLKVIVQGSDEVSLKDMETWKQWVKIIYDADLSIIKNNVNLFTELTDLLILQLELFPDAYKEELLVSVYSDANNFLKKLEQADNSILALRVMEFRLLLN